MRYPSLVVLLVVSLGLLNVCASADELSQEPSNTMPVTHPNAATNDDIVKMDTQKDPRSQRTAEPSTLEKIKKHDEMIEFIDQFVEDMEKAGGWVLNPDPAAGTTLVPLIIWVDHYTFPIPLGSAAGPPTFDSGGPAGVEDGIPDSWQLTINWVFDDGTTAMLTPEELANATDGHPWIDAHDRNGDGIPDSWDHDGDGILDIGDDDFNGIPDILEHPAN